MRNKKKKYQTGVERDVAIRKRQHEKIEKYWGQKKQLEQVKV